MKTDVGPSEHQDRWYRALHGGDNAMLMQLVKDEPPGVCLFHIATYINGIYSLQRGWEGFLGRDLPSEQEDSLHVDALRAASAADLIRARLTWPQRRVLDMGLLRWIRRSSALTPVLGAGVTMDAGGPSWAGLVGQLLDIAMTRGHEIYRIVPTPASTEERIRLFSQVDRTMHLSAGRREEAIAIRDKIQAGRATTADLQRGAEICRELFGEHMLTHVTEILYASAKEPSSIHRAIADLADRQFVPDRRASYPGWEQIITYNFDSLMSEALTDRAIPNCAWAMKQGQVYGDPDEKAQNSDWYLSIFHLHGYTPRRLFQIGGIDFVFSISQYLEVYGRRENKLIDQALEGCLASPRRVALYVGCSFADEAMNVLLSRAHRLYPGRWHYAFLRLPNALQSETADPWLLNAAEEKYHQLGVQPIWVRNYSEIPALIREMK